MPPKTGAVSNVIETLREPVRNIKRDVVKQVGNIPLDLVKMLYIDPEHKFRTEEEIEQIENHDKMARLEGFKQARRELDAMQGKVVSEETIDEETRKQIEEEEKRLSESLQRFDVSSRDTASDLGKTPQNEEAQVEQQIKLAEEEERKRKEADEQARLEIVVEAPPGRETGLNPKFKRMRNPWRGTPRSTEKLKRAGSKIASGAEQRAGRGVGG